MGRCGMVTRRSIAHEINGKNRATQTASCSLKKLMRMALVCVKINCTATIACGGSNITSTSANRRHSHLRPRRGSERKSEPEKLSLPREPPLITALFRVASAVWPPSSPASNAARLSAWGGCGSRGGARMCGRCSSGTGSAPERSQ